MSKLAFIDCDSTLSSIEGIDELARFRGPEVMKEVEDLTNAAMDGKVPLAEVFGRRIDLIQPDEELCAKVQDLYIQTVEPDARDLVKRLKANGWRVLILSGGFAKLIQPLANYLEVDEVLAVPLYLTEDGTYKDFGRTYPTTYNGGKPELIRKLKEEHRPTQTLMVGDGISDFEATPEVTTFVGYGGYVRREAVEQQSKHYVTELKQLFSPNSSLQSLIFQGS